MKDIMSAVKYLADSDVSDKEGNYIERFNAEVLTRKTRDPPFSLLNGKAHLAGNVV